MIENHPSYCGLSIDVGPHSGPLFGTDLAHDRVVTLTVRKVSVDRDIDGEKIIPGPVFVKVQLTPSQLGQALSLQALTPCTLYEKDGHGISPPLKVVRDGPALEAYRESVGSVLTELEEANARFLSELDAVKMPKSAKEDLLRALAESMRLYKEAGPNLMDLFVQCLNQLSS